MSDNKTSEYLEIFVKKLSHYVNPEDFRNANKDTIFNIVEDLLDKHGEEFTKLYKVYGPQVLSVILAMFEDKKTGKDKYYDAIEEKTASELLGESIDHFRKAREKGESFDAFLKNVGSGAGIILKALLKSVNPFT